MVCGYTMDITFKNRKLQKAFNEGAQLEKIHGTLRARKIRLRMKELRAARSLWISGRPKVHPPGVMS